MLYFIIACALAFLLQWWLAGRRSRVPGLILPLLHLILSAILILSFAAYSFTGTVETAMVITAEPGQSVVMLDESGNVLSVNSIPEELKAVPDTPDSSSIGIIGGADGPTSIFIAGSTEPLALAGGFLLLNIPTAILLIEYIVRRRQLKRRNIDKTRIQDL